MLDRVSKPRVFLSHSKKDVEFITTLYNDLRRCQIEPWLDSEEIRHGQPWLSAIFEDGLPTCDCVLVYLTEDSIQSGMVKKEIDVGVINKLQDNSISFLPYVNDAGLRRTLRGDLQALQAPEWNSENYHEMLPIVVSEIWRSYMERKVTGAISAEKSKRLEAELELERMKSKSNKGPFRIDEVEDFEYIYRKLDRSEEFVVKLDGKREASENEEGKRYKVNLLSLVPQLVAESNDSYSDWNIEAILEDVLTEGRIDFLSSPKLEDEFLMYGFLERIHIPPPRGEDRMTAIMMGNGSNKLLFTNKVDRFRYWLNYEGKSADKPNIEEEKTT